MDNNQNDNMSSTRSEFRVGSEVQDPTYGAGRVIRLTMAGSIIASVVVLFYKLSKEYEYTPKGVFDLESLRIISTSDALAKIGNTVVQTVKDIAEGASKPGNVAIKETLTWRQLASQLQGMHYREGGQLYNIVQKRIMFAVSKHEGSKMFPRLETISTAEELMDILNPLFPEDWAKDILMKALVNKKKLPIGIQIVDKPGTSNVNKKLYETSTLKLEANPSRKLETGRLKLIANQKFGVGVKDTGTTAFATPRVVKPQLVDTPKPILPTSRQPVTIHDTITRLNTATNPFDKAKTDSKMYDAMNEKVARRKSAAALLQDLVQKDTSAEEKTIDNVMSRMFGGDKHYQKLAGYYDDLLTFEHTGAYIGQSYDKEGNEIVRRMTTYAGKRVDQRNALELKRASQIGLSEREAAELSKLTTIESVLSNRYITSNLSKPGTDVLSLLHSVVPLESDHASLKSSMSELSMFIPQSEQLGWSETMDKLRAKVRKPATDKNLLKTEIFEDLNKEAERVLLEINPYLLNENNRDLFMDSAVNWRMRDVYKEGPDDANSVIKLLEKSLYYDQPVGSIYSTTDDIANAVSLFRQNNAEHRNNTVSWHRKQLTAAEEHHAKISSPVNIVKNRILDINLRITKGSGTFNPTHDNTVLSFEEMSQLGVENQRLLELLEDPKALGKLVLTTEEKKEITDSRNKISRLTEEYIEAIRTAPNKLDASLLGALPELSVASNVKETYNYRIDLLNSMKKELQVLQAKQLSGETLSVHEKEILDAHTKNGTTIEEIDNSISKIRQKINLLGDMSTYAMQSYTGEATESHNAGDIVSNPLQEHGEANEQTVGGKKIIENLKNADFNELFKSENANINAELDAKLEERIKQRVGNLSSQERTLAMAENSTGLSTGRIQMSPGYDPHAHFLALATEGKLDNEEKLLEQFDLLKMHHENFMETNLDAKYKFWKKGNAERAKTGKNPTWFDMPANEERFKLLETEVKNKQKLLIEIERNINLKKSGKNPEWWKVLQGHLDTSANDSYWSLAVDEKDFFQKMKTTRTAVSSAGIGHVETRLTKEEHLITVNAPKITDLEAPDMSVITDLIQKLSNRENNQVIDLDKKYRFGNSNPEVSIDDILKHAGIESEYNPKNLTFKATSDVKNLAYLHDQSLGEDFTTTLRNGIDFEIQGQVNIEAKEFLNRQLQKSIKDGIEVTNPEVEFSRLLRQHLSETSTQLSILRNIAPNMASKVSVGLGLHTEDYAEKEIAVEQEILENAPQLHTSHNQSTIHSLISQYQSKVDELQYQLEEAQIGENKILSLQRNLAPQNPEFANLTDDDIDKKIAYLLTANPKKETKKLEHKEKLKKLKAEVAIRKSNKEIIRSNRKLQGEVTRNPEQLKALEVAVDKKQTLIEEIELINKRIGWAREVQKGNVSPHDVDWLLGQYHAQAEVLGLNGKVAHPLVNHPEIIQQMHDLGIGDLIRNVTYDGQTLKATGTIKIGDNIYINAPVPSGDGTTHFNQPARVNVEGTVTIKQDDYNKVMNEPTRILMNEITTVSAPTNKRLVENNGISTFLDSATSRTTGQESLERLLAARQNGSTAFLMDTEFFRNNIFQVGYGEYSFRTNQLSTTSKFIEVDKTVAAKMKEYLMYQDKTISENELKFLRIGIKNTLKTLQEATGNMAFGTNAYTEQNIDNALNFMSNQHEKLTMLSPANLKTIESIKPVKLTEFVENTLLANNSDYIMNQNLLGADIGTIVRQLKNVRAKSIAEYDSIGALITRVQGLTGKSIDTMMAMYAATGVHAGLGNYTNIGHEGSADIVAVIEKQLAQIDAGKANSIKDALYYVNKTTGHIYTPDGNMKAVTYSGKDGEIEDRFEQSFKRISDPLKHENFRTLENITVTGPTESNLAANAINSKFFRFDTIEDAKIAREQLIKDKAVRRITPNPSRKVASGSEDMYYVKSDIRAAEMLNNTTNPQSEIEKIEKRIHLLESRGVPTAEARIQAAQSISELDANREALEKLTTYLTPEQRADISVQESIIKALGGAKHTFADVEIADAQKKIDRIKVDPKYRSEEQTQLIDNLKKYIMHTETDEEYLRTISDPKNPIISKTSLEIEKRALRKFKNATDVERVIRVNSNIQGQMLLNAETVYNAPNSAYSATNGVVAMIDTLLEKVNYDTLTIAEANNVYKKYMSDLVNSGVIASHEVLRKDAPGDVTKRFADHTLTIFGDEQKLSRLDTSTSEKFNKSLIDNIFRINGQLKKDVEATKKEVLDSIVSKFSSLDKFREELLNEKINVTDQQSFSIVTPDQYIKLQQITSSYQDTIKNGSEAIQTLINHRDPDPEAIPAPVLNQKMQTPIANIQHELMSETSNEMRLAASQEGAMLKISGGAENLIRGTAESAMGMHNKFGAAGTAIAALMIGGLTAFRPNLNTKEQAEKPEGKPFTIKGMFKDMANSYKSIDKFAQNIDDKLMGKKRKEPQEEEDVNRMPMHRTLQYPIDAYKSVDNFAERMDIQIRGTMKKEVDPGIVAHLTHSAINMVTKKVLGVDLDEKRENKKPDKYWARGLTSKL